MQIFEECQLSAWAAGTLASASDVGVTAKSNQQKTDHLWDRSQDRGRLPIFHVTLLGKLRLPSGLQWFHTPADILIILLITA